MSFVSVYIYVAVYILEYLRYTEICQDSSTKLFTTLLVPLSASQACTTPLTPALKSVAELACHLRHIWEDGTLNCRSGLYTWSSNSEIYRRGEEEQKRKRTRRDEETRRRGDEETRGKDRRRVSGYTGFDPCATTHYNTLLQHTTASTPTREST
jgi:hypothetical protein